MKTIFLTIILTVSSQAPDTALVRQSFAYTKQELIAADVNLRLVKIQKVREVRAQRKEMATVRYYYWHRWKIEQGIVGRAMVILPHAINKYDAIGLAPVCLESAIAVVNFAKKDTEETVQSKIVFAHEVGHLLGADHLPSGSIMDPSILRGEYTEDAMPHFAEKSVEEVKVCLDKEIAGRGK